MLLSFRRGRLRRRAGLLFPIRPAALAVLTASALAVSVLTLPAPPAQAAPNAAPPASDADMSLYTRIATINVCIARSAGVEFGKAVAIAGETIAQVIQGQHGGVIRQVGSQALNLEELRKGSINSAVLGAAEVCPKELPPDVLQKAQEVLKAPRGGAAPVPAPKAK